MVRSRRAQPPTARTPVSRTPVSPPLRHTFKWAALFCLVLLAPRTLAQALPDAPSSLMEADSSATPDTASPLLAAPALGPQTTSPTRKPRCKPRGTISSPEANAASSAQSAAVPCQAENPVQSVVTKPVRPLTVEGKAQLALRDFTDPFNFITIAGSSGISIAASSHSAFGPGFAGWGRLTGYNLLEDAQGEFVGTFLIPSLVHEDPRYHRMPGAPIKRRILHAIAHTYVSQHDDGTRMINYATLINYPVSAELANLYVPGIRTDGPATARRFLTGIATDPSGTLVAEFLPDVARHIHVHLIVFQEIINKVATGANAPNVQ